VHEQNSIKQNSEGFLLLGGQLTNSVQSSSQLDMLVFSHLRWDFVFQRPQHLLTRFARERRVVFWEEPRFEAVRAPTLDVSARDRGLSVVVPIVPSGTDTETTWSMQRELLAEFLGDFGLGEYVCWYYTPLALNFTDELEPAVVVYDCMDELSAFRGAPPGLAKAEAELFLAADLVFTGGQSLFQSKRNRHPSVHLFPSSIDTTHFGRARQAGPDPADQATIAHPRIGYCGVIDERMDYSLLDEVARLRPEWQFLMVGPVVKVSESDLPRRANIHYLGSKNYLELPSYFSGWDVGMLPFALNESTRFISPTKTPEYLAAGLPVVSTPITDVVKSYGDLGLVSIARSAE